MTSSRYLPHTDEEIRAMLDAVGAESLEALFKHIPKPCLIPAPSEKNSDLFYSIEGPLDEESLRRRFASFASTASATKVTPFIGAGYYPHSVPSAAKEILRRSEFYTAYTPYQPEIAQGTLQCIFEFQTLICQLTGCEVSNASHYNGASATAEAALMALRLTGRKKVLAHRALQPQYQDVLKTYLSYTAKVGFVPFELDSGVTDLQKLKAELNEETAAVIIQNPNFLGGIEDLRGISSLVHDYGALLIVVVTEPLSLGLLAPPASLGADIVVGEGGTFGQGLNYGGPGVGFFATAQKYLRDLPGRLCGETVDKEGKRAFVLTLSTREQHIRRQKATSNICTNQALCALAFTLTIGLLGKVGFRKLAEINLSKAHYLKERLGERKIRPLFKGSFFNECSYGPLKIPAAGVLDELLRQGYVAGLPLGDYYPDIPELQKALLICTTEEHTRSQIEAMANALDKVNR